MRDQPLMREFSAADMTSTAAQKGILRQRTTSEGDALKMKMNDEDLVDLIGGGWKALGLDYDDDEGVVGSVLSSGQCQVAVAKEFDKSVAKDLNAFKSLKPKKVDPNKLGGGPLLFGHGKVPTQQPGGKNPGQNGLLANLRVDMNDPSSLLKDASVGANPVVAAPPKQLPLPPMLRKRDSTTSSSAIANALSRAMSQPASRAPSRPESPSRMFSLPPATSPEFVGGDISNLLSMAAQGLNQSSTTRVDSDFNGFQYLKTSGSIQNDSAHNQQTTRAISQQNGAFKEVQQNSTMTTTATTQVVQRGNQASSGAASQSTSLAAANKSKSVSNLSIDISLEINDPKPMMLENTDNNSLSASFKPLEPSHQTHHSPLKVPKPVSPRISDAPPPAPKEEIFPKFSFATPPPPVEARGSVLAPAAAVSGTTANRNSTKESKKTDYSFYLDLINDGDDDNVEGATVATPKAPPRTKHAAQKPVVTTEEHTMTKDFVKQTKSVFENGEAKISSSSSAQTKQQQQQQVNASRSCCGNHGKSGKSSSSSSSSSVVVATEKNTAAALKATSLTTTTKGVFNEPKLEGCEASAAALQLKVQSGANLASLLAKDEMQCSMLLTSTDGFDDRSEGETVLKESLVKNVRATSAKWNETLKKEEKVIKFESNIVGGAKQQREKTTTTTSTIQKSQASAANKNSEQRTTAAASKAAGGIGLGSNPQSMGNMTKYAGNPEQLLLSAIGSAGAAVPAAVASATKQVAAVRAAQNSQTSASWEVIEHQKKIEMERQKQEEYEMNQRKIVIEKDSQRNFIPKENEVNELKLQLERRRALEQQMAEQQMKAQEEERKKLEAEQRRIAEMQQQQRQQQQQEEAKRKAEAERQRLLEIKKREEEQKRIEAERVRIINLQRQEEERKKAEAERQRVLEIQRQEEERKRAEAERQRLLEIQRQEEERRRLLEIQRQEEERQRSLEIQRQEEERQRSLEIQRQEEERQRMLEIQRQEEERQRLLEIQRQEEERIAAEAERQRLLEIQRREEERRGMEEEQERIRKEEEARRQLEEEQKMQYQEQQLSIEIENKRIQEEKVKTYQQSQFHLEQQQRLMEIHHLQNAATGGEDEEREMRRKIHEEQLRLLRSKQEEEQQQLLLLHQQEESNWESKRRFIEKSGSSSFVAEQSTIVVEGSSMASSEFSSTATSTSTVIHVDATRQLSPKSSVRAEDHSRSPTLLTPVPAERVTVHAAAAVAAAVEGSDVVEYAAPVIRSGGHRPSTSDDGRIDDDDNGSDSRIPIVEKTLSPPLVEAPPIVREPVTTPPVVVEEEAIVHRPVVEAAGSSIPRVPVIVDPSAKVDIVDDPLSFLLSNSPISSVGSPVSICSSLSSTTTAAATPSPNPIVVPSPPLRSSSSPNKIIPAAPAPPPLQPSYRTMSTGDPILELRARFSESPGPLQPHAFNDPILPNDVFLSTSSVPPSHAPPSPVPTTTPSFNHQTHHQTSNNNHLPSPQPRPPPSQQQQQQRQRQHSSSSSREEEVVSPKTQRKRLMAQCMSEVAIGSRVLPSQVKAAKTKTTKSRVERMIEKSCGEPQTIVRKTASGKEYIEVISPENMENARSILEPPASR